MRAPKDELPIRFDAFGVRAGAVTILDGIDLTISAGAPTVIVGPNGSGKTTLLRAAMGLPAPSQYDGAPAYQIAGRITHGGAADVPPPFSSVRTTSPRNVVSRLDAALNAPVPASRTEVIFSWIVL